MSKSRLFMLLGVIVLSLALVGMALAADNAQQPPPPAQEASTGTAPAGEEGGVNSLTGSFVAFDPSVGGDVCYNPDTAQTFCFRAESFSPDYEYVYNLWEKFPTNWTVTNVFVQGTPWCDNGSWGTFSWSFQTNPYEVKITHSRFQGSGGAHCIAYYCFEVVSEYALPDALVSWFWDGDGYGGPPHWPCSNDGYAPAGFTCDEAINPRAAVPPCALDPGIYLLPEELIASGCNGVPQEHEFTLFNNTGADGTFDMTYTVPPIQATLTGPAQVTAPNGANVPFEVILEPYSCTFDPIVGEINAVGNGYEDTAIINKTIDTAGDWIPIATEPNNGRMDNVVASFDNLVWSITGYGANTDVRYYDPANDTWTVVPGSTPPFANNYARSGCTAGNKVYLYGDAAGTMTGLWSYNMDSNVWTQETPSGTPPAQTGIWAPAWVFDPASGYCYMTGGASAPGAGNLTTVYVYDPATNAWLSPLPNFANVRDFHAAFIYNRPADAHHLLCVVGGNNAVGMTSTQCYDFMTGGWNAENADMGALPASLWGMGYTDKWHFGTDHQLWLLGGVNAAGALTTTAWYFDVNTGVWVDASPYAGTGTYRTSATTLNNEIYKLGGSIGGFTYTGLAWHHVQCPLCVPPDIEIISDPLHAIQPPDAFSTIPMGICNIGGSPLDWALLEIPFVNNLSHEQTVALPTEAIVNSIQSDSTSSFEGVVTQVGAGLQGSAGSSGLGNPEAVLWDNGPLVTLPAACGGMDASRLQTDLGMNTLGFGHQFDLGYRMADDFEIIDPFGWQIDQITFFAYQTGAPSNPSPITGVYYQIWDGPPNDPGSSIVYGDLVTNRLVSSTNPNMQRDSGTTPCANNRYIFADVASAGLALPPGIYWIDWMTDGNLTSGPWAPPITILGQITTGNAMQYTTAWAPALDTGTSTQQGMPFIVEGTVIAPPDIPWLSENPVSGLILPGECTVPPVDINFDSTGMMPGDYFGNLLVLSNDPIEPVVDLPVALTVITASIEKLAPPTAFPGDTFSYVINIEPSAFIGTAVLTDVIPVGLEFANNLACNIGTCNYDAGAVYWNYSVPPAGESTVPAQPVTPLTGNPPANPGLTTQSGFTGAPVKPQESTHPEAILWDQPLSAVSQAAYVNQNFPDFPDYSAFLADDFTSADIWSISTIFVPGDGWNGFSTLMNATALTWQIYADDAGVPAGDPYGGGAPPVWTLTLLPTDPQVVITNGTPGGMPSNTQLNLASPVFLPPGHYWLVFYPTMNFVPTGQYGRQPADTTNGYTGQFINPGGGFGFGTTWQDWSVLGPTQQDIAFRLEGEVIPFPFTISFDVLVTTGNPDLIVNTADLWWNGLTVSAQAETQILVPEITLAKTVGTDPMACATTDAITVTVGTEVTYCYTVYNSGNVLLTTHDLVDSVLGPIFTGYPLDLAPGAGAYVTTTATIVTDTVNTGTWTAWADAVHFGEATSNPATVTIARADLVVTKTGPDTARVGELITYTINVANLGPVDATNVVIVDTLPVGATFVSAPAFCSNAAGVVTCNVPLIPAGGNSNFEIVITMGAIGPALNSVTATADQLDPDMGNNTATWATDVVPANFYFFLPIVQKN